MTTNDFGLGWMESYLPPRAWAVWRLFATLATAATLRLLPPPTAGTAWFVGMGLSFELLNLVVESTKAERARVRP